MTKLDDIMDPDDEGFVGFNAPAADVAELRPTVGFDSHGAYVLLVGRMEDDRIFSLILPRDYSPMVLAGELAGCAREVLRMSGLSAIEQRAYEKELERSRAKAERETVEDLKASAPTCSLCPRHTSVIDEDGTRYCKRHAREHGILVTGKI